MKLYGVRIIEHLKKENIDKGDNKMKIGDIVKTTDTSYMTMINVLSNSIINKDLETFKIINFNPDFLCTTSGRSHDVFIENIETRERYLHSLRFLKLVEIPRIPYSLKNLHNWVSVKKALPDNCRIVRLHIKNLSDIPICREGLLQDNYWLARYNDSMDYSPVKCKVISWCELLELPEG